MLATLLNFFNLEKQQQQEVTADSNWQHVDAPAEAMDVHAEAPTDVADGNKFSQCNDEQNGIY